MKSIAVVGKPYLNFVEYIEQFHPELEIVAFQDSTDPQQYPDSVKRVFSVRFSSFEAMAEDVKQLPKLNIVGLETEFETGVLPKAWLGKLLGLPALDLEAALTATDKLRQRRAFQKQHPEISPAFHEAGSWEEVRQFARQYGFPLILKPANLSKSLLVTKNDSMAELEKNFRFAQRKMAEVYDRYGIYYRQPSLLVEEFLAGPAFSVDVVTDAHQNITPLPAVELIMARDIGIKDNYNYWRKLPSQLDAAAQRVVQEAAIKGVQSLGFTHTAGHTELVLTENGPKIIEIGSRFGGYRNKMYQLSYGLNINEAILRLAMGEPVTLTPQFQAYSAVYELFPQRTGRFERIENKAAVSQLASFESCRVPAKPGDMVGLSRDGYKFCANITLTHQDQAVFEKDCQFVETSVRVVLAGESETLKKSE